MSAPQETTHVGRFEGYGPPRPALGRPDPRGLATAYAELDTRVEKLQAAINDIREYCTDAADIGSTYLYIEVVEAILKRHGIDA